MIPEKEELAIQIDEAEWDWLRSHLERGGLILVDDTLDLAEAAFKVSADDVETIQKWINAGQLGRPDESQISQWDMTRQKRFAMLIVSPYVLIQEKTRI